MEISIKDYSGYNSECNTVKRVLGYVESYGTCNVEDLFSEMPELRHSLKEFHLYIIDDRKEEYKAWALKYFSYENQMELNAIEFRKLYLRLYEVKDEIARVEGLTPAKVYSYFVKPQKYITDIEHSVILNKILYGILASSVFVSDDYELLYKTLQKTRNPQYRTDTEWHYRIAIQNNNRSAWKSIELFLKRKPYLIDKKRCYQDFKFIDLESNQYYRCTGWNEVGNIKFVSYFNPSESGKRKQYSFTRKQFNEHFKDKKIVV